MANHKHPNTDQIIDLYIKGLRIEDISVQCSADSATVVRIAKKAGLRRQPKVKQELIRLCEKGFTRIQVCIIMKKSMKQLNKHFRAYGF